MAPASRVRAHHGIEVAREEHLFVGNANVVGMDGKRRRQFACVADRELICERLRAVRRIEDDDPGVPLTRPWRKTLIEKLLVDEGTIDQERVGRKLTAARARVSSVIWKGRNNRAREFGERDCVPERCQERAVIEDPIARAHQRFSVGIQLTQKTDAGRNVIAIDRVFLACAEQRVVRLVHRNDQERHATEYETNHRASRRAERHADADLGPPQVHRIRRHSIEADSRHEERERSERCRQHREQPLALQRVGDLGAPLVRATRARRSATTSRPSTSPPRMSRRKSNRSLSLVGSSTP
jgi:hypothetical protein